VDADGTRAVDRACAFVARNGSYTFNRLVFVYE